MASLATLNKAATPLAAEALPAARPARHRPSAGPAALGLLAAALLASLVLQPAWPAHLVSSLLWFGGAWRWLAVPGSVVAAVAATVANAARPGAWWRTMRAAAGRLRNWTPAAAALIGLASAGYSAGVLSGSAVAEAIFLFLLQVALFPGTPVVGLMLAVAVVVTVADARGHRFISLVRRYGERGAGPQPQGMARAARATWPALAVATGAAVFAAAIFPSAMQGWTRAEAPDARRYNFYSSFFNHAISADRIGELESYRLGERGLTLPPGASGSIVFRLERPPESLALLKANFYHRRFDQPSAAGADATFTNALEVSTDQGGSYRTILADTSLGEVIGTPDLDLTPFLGASRTYWLRFRATNTTNSEVTVLPSVVVSVVTDPLTLPHPTFPVVAYSAAVALLAYAAARSAGVPTREACAGALAAAAATACLAAAAQAVGARVAAVPPAPAAGALLDPAADSGSRYALGAARGVFALLAAGVGALLWRRRRSGRGGRAPWLAAGCLVVALVALDARWQALIQVRHEFLLPDAQGYQSIAEEFPEKLARYAPQRSSPLLSKLYAVGYDGRASVPAVFYAGGNNGREPLWPATLRVVFNVLGASAFHTRLASLALGVLVAALTCWIGWRMLHPLVGVTAGLLIALHPPHIANSVSGLREPLATVLYLLLMGGLFVGARRGGAVSWWRSAGVGAAAGALILVRADMLVLAVVLTILAAAALRWPWPHWLGSMVVMGLLAGPMYVGYAFTHGDPFYPGTYGATVNRNLEFPERMGTPGFPSPEEYAANWAAGPKISPMQYFFGAHMTALRREQQRERLASAGAYFPGEGVLPPFLDYSLRGFLRIFPTVLFEQQPVLLRLCVVGMALLLVTRRWLVPFAVVISLAPFYAFMAGVPNPWVFPGRYAHHALPFVEMATAYAVWCVPLWLAARFSGRWRPRPAAGEPLATAAG